jgi:hypothetical protein
LFLRAVPLLALDEELGSVDIFALLAAGFVIRACTALSFEVYFVFASAGLRWNQPEFSITLDLVARRDLAPFLFPEIFCYFEP